MEPLSHLVVYIGLDHYLGVTPRETRLTDRLPVRRLVVLQQRERSTLIGISSKGIQLDMPLAMKKVAIIAAIFYRN